MFHECFLYSAQIKLIVFLSSMPHVLNFYLRFYTCRKELSYYLMHIHHSNEAVMQMRESISSTSQTRELRLKEQPLLFGK